jgi:hypothetical protein
MRKPRMRRGGSKRGNSQHLDTRLGHCNKGIVLKLYPFVWLIVEDPTWV